MPPEEPLATLDPATLAARLRTSQDRGFRGRPTREGAPGFRPRGLGQTEPAAADLATPPGGAGLAEVPTTLPAALPGDLPGDLPTDPQAEALEAARREAFAAGLAQGRAEGQALASAEMEKARDSFLAAARQVTLQGADLSDQIAALLADALRGLAAQRAGQAIDALPQPFLARIATLADHVAQGMRSVAVHLHPDDLAALRPHLPGSELQDVTLTAAPGLQRGDVEVRAEGIRLADRLGAV